MRLAHSWLLPGLLLSTQHACGSDVEPRKEVHVGDVTPYREQADRHTHATAGTGSAQQTSPLTAQPPTEPSPSAEDGGVDPLRFSSDDDVRCGDAVLQETEACDVAIPQGAPGACPVQCVQLDPCVELELIVSGCRTHCRSTPSNTPGC